MKVTSIRCVCAVAAVIAALAVSPVVTGQADFDNVEITATQLDDNLYYLQGQGGQIGVLAGPDGVLMVDTQFAPLTERIVAAIRQISTEPIKFALNTHVHGDHTGGNSNLLAMGRDGDGSRRAARGPGQCGESAHTPADGDLRGTGNLPYERGDCPGDSRAGRPHSRRHDGVFRERRCVDDRRFLSVGGVPQHCSSEWRHAGGHVARPRERDRAVRPRTPEFFQATVPSLTVTLCAHTVT